MPVDNLRAARTALDEGLISEDDFDGVKVAFLKAQQYKAGVDAGFIEPADYAEVKARFLDDVSRLSITPSAYGSAQPARPSATGAPSQAAPCNCSHGDKQQCRFSEPSARAM